MKNRYIILIFMLCSVLASSASTVWSLQGVNYTVDTLSHVVIGPGTTQTSLSLNGAVKLRVFYTVTDMTNPNVNMKLIMGKDNLTSTVTVPNMPASQSDDENEYIAGVNADFFSSTGPIGTTVANGYLYKSYKGTGWYAMGIGADKKLYSGAPYTTFKMVSPNAGQASIKAVNVARSSAEMILYTSQKGSSTGTSGTGVEVGAVAVDGMLKSNGSTKMRVTVAPVSGNGNMAIPANGFVLSGTGFTADILSKMKLGEEFEVTPTIYFNNVVADNIEEMAGGCPMLLQGAKILETQGLLDHLVTRQPRTAFGYTADGSKTVMLVVDGRQSGVSEGVVSKDLAAMMKILGCSEAINFDGGGSTTLYVKELGVVNIPSESGVLRPVKDGLFVTTPKTNDNEIAKIRFADYVGKVNKNSTYTPIIYGYNAQDVLINKNVANVTLSCSSEMGEVQTGGKSVLCTGVGTYALTAELGDKKATIAVTVSDPSSVNDIQIEKSVAMYPNPVKVGAEARITLNEPALITIYDINSKQVVAYSSEAGRDIVLPTSMLSAGVYIVKVEGNTTNQVGKLIIN